MAKSDTRDNVAIGLAGGSTALVLMTIVSYFFVALAITGVIGGFLLAYYGPLYGVPQLRVAAFFAFLCLILLLVLVPLAIAMSGAQVLTVIMSGAALIGLKRSSGGAPTEGTAPPARRYATVLAVISATIGLVMLSIGVVSCVALTRKSETERARIHSESIVRVARALDNYYDRGSVGTITYAPRLAAAAWHAPGGTHAFELDITLGDGPRTMRRSDVIPSGARPETWPAYASAIDAISNYEYVGCDLPKTPAMYAQSHRIVLLYTKRSVQGGRVVAFANHTTRLVPNSDLPALFADASAARATLGLPPISPP